MTRRAGGSVPVALLDAASWATPRLAGFTRMALAHAVRRGLAEQILRRWRRVTDPAHIHASPAVPPPAAVLPLPPPPPAAALPPLPIPLPLPLPVPAAPAAPVAPVAALPGPLHAALAAALFGAGGGGEGPP